MTLVVDASVGLPWLLEDETSAEADAILVDVQGGATVQVPSHWPLEIASGLWSAERRRRLTPAGAAEAIEMLRSLPIILHELPQRIVFGPVLALARDHNLTVYDAAYLELAMRQRLPLATLDTQLAKVARRVGVDLVF